MNTGKTFRMLGLFACAVLLGWSSVLVSPADAKGRGYYSQDFEFDGPKHGYEGQAPAGAAYCSYQRIPNRQCIWVNGKEKCKIVSWTLRQTCQ